MKNNPKSLIMTASNINIEEFISILTTIWENGSRYINLDMLPDDTHPSMNKLIVHPVRPPDELERESSNTRSSNRDEIPVPESREEMEIRNPKVSTKNNDIFDMLNSLI